jgi:regulatory protein YycI of two-component signal transduction system YycFG
VKRVNKVIFFFLVLILFLFLTYNVIESAQWNAKRIEMNRNIEMQVALGNITCVNGNFIICASSSPNLPYCDEKITS